MNQTTESSPPILLCGIGPVPPSNPERLFGPGIRVWGFAQALVRSGVAVDLLEVRFEEAMRGGGSQIHRLALKEDSEEVIAVSTEPLTAERPAGLVEQCLARETYSGIVSSTDVMNLACVEACGELPLWCDYYGHPMAERQSQAHVYQSDEGLAGQWDYILGPLLRADRISGTCESQRLALVGELGACGRLGYLTDGYQPACSLRPTAIFTEFSPPPEPVIRGKIVDEDDFVILWAGGYNTWSDPDVLADALILAIHRNRNIHYVSVGGAIPGHDERTYARFVDRIEKSGIMDNCHLVGWVTPGEVSAYYLEADVGINCDRPTFEGELGTRSRILEWVFARLPVVSSALCELSTDLGKRDLIDTCPPGDGPALAECFLACASRSREERKARAEKARNYLLDAYEGRKIYASLIEWAREPSHAPDISPRNPKIPGVPFIVPPNSLAHRRAGEWRSVWRSPGLAGRIARKIASRLGG